MPVMRTKNEDFFKTWSSEMAYVLGFIFADGSIVQNKRGAHFLEFTSTDKELILKIRELLKSNHSIGKYQPRGVGNKKRYRLQIGSKEWARQLKDFGIIQNKSLVVSFPVVPQEFLSHFVRGYFDGDGGVSLGRCWRKDRQEWKWEFTMRFTSGSKKFLSGLWDALSNYTAGGYLYEKNRGYELVFARHDSIALFQFMYHNVSASSYLERKYAVFQEALKILRA